MKQRILLLIAVIAFATGLVFFVLKQSGSFITYDYVVEIEKCNYKKDTVYFTTRGGGNGFIETYREAVPVLSFNRKKFINVCDYTILSKTKK